MKFKIIIYLFAWVLLFPSFANELSGELHLLKSFFPEGGMEGNICQVMITYDLRQIDPNGIDPAIEIVINGDGAARFLLIDDSEELFTFPRSNTEVNFLNDEELLTSTHEMRVMNIPGKKLVTLKAKRSNSMISYIEIFERRFSGQDELVFEKLARCAL